MLSRLRRKAWEGAMVTAFERLREEGEAIEAWTYAYVGPRPWLLNLVLAKLPVAVERGGVADAAEEDRQAVPGRLGSAAAPAPALQHGALLPSHHPRRRRSDLFGNVASTPTAYRLIESVDDELLDRLREARAQARASAWAMWAAPTEILLVTGTDQESQMQADERTQSTSSDGTRSRCT